MKVYEGHTTDDNLSCVVSVTDDNGTSRPLAHHVYHSPSGFSWGYGGSGPSDLARSILWDHLGHEPRPNLYHDFKFAVVASWGRSWQLTSDEVSAYIAEWREAHPDVPLVAGVPSW